MSTSLFRPAETDAGEFRPLGERAETVLPVDRRIARSSRRLFSGDDGYEVAIREQLTRRMLTHARAAAPNETYGLLVGHLHRDQQGEHAVVEGIVIDADVVSGRASVATSHASELRTRELCRRLYPDCVILGWFHTHPRYGLVFSGTDRRNQATWTRPYALGIVVDPWDPDEIAVYRGPECERLRLAARDGGVPAGPVARDSLARPAGVRESSHPMSPTPRRERCRVARALGLALSVAIGVFALVRMRALDARVTRLEDPVPTVRAVDRFDEPDITTHEAAVESLPPADVSDVAAGQLDGGDVTADADAARDAGIDQRDVAPPRRTTSRRGTRNEPARDVMESGGVARPL